MTLEDCAIRLKVDKDWLLNLMQIESRNNPQAINPYSGAVGLISFMPFTAKRLGTTLSQLLAMNYNQQMDYVYKYLVPFKGRWNSFTDFYLSVFFPFAIEQPNDYILQTKKIPAWLIAKQNPAFDKNKDQKITKQEIEDYLKYRFPHNYKNNEPCL